ncbi:MAG: hypothetical protein ABSE06_12330 [Anaerolineaceae bacterium]
MALNVGLTPVEIKEVSYQCAPYIGFPQNIERIISGQRGFY